MMIKNFYQFNEGINLDHSKKIVSITDEHEEGFNTSVENNPITYTIQDLKNPDNTNIKVYSIFSRYKSSNIEYANGNPLIFGMKKIGWNISAKDKTELYNRMNLIIQKIKTMLNKDLDDSVIVCTPSSNVLNTEFTEEINKVFNKKVVNISTEKLSKAEVKQAVRDAEDIPSWAKSEIYACMGKMQGDNFTFKKITPAYRQYIKNIFKPKESAATAVATLDDSNSDIMGKTVIVLDDTISTGTTLKLFIEEIKQYEPKNIIVITMFSKLMDVDKTINIPHKYDKTGKRIPKTKL